MTILRAFAVLVFVGLSGLAIATLLVSREPIPAEVTGSPTPAEYPLRWVYGVLYFGDFITRAPDGEAHVQIRYDRPEAFKRLVHAAIVARNCRRRNVLLPRHFRSAMMEPIGPMSPRPESKTAQLPSTLETLERTNSGKCPSSNQAMRRRLSSVSCSFVRDQNILQRVPVDVVWLWLAPASILILICFQVPLSAGRLFAVTAIPVLLFVFTYTLMDVGYHLVLTQDSAAYLQLVIKGSYASTRSAGYQTILWAVHKADAGLEHLAWVQLGACIACYLAGARLLAVRSGNNRWMGPVLVLAVLFQEIYGTICTCRHDGSAVYSGIWAVRGRVGGSRPTARQACAWWRAVVGIILAILTKSIGVVLVLPALLLMHFLPREKRLSVSGAIVMAGLATYGLLAVQQFRSVRGDLSAESFRRICARWGQDWLDARRSHPCRRPTSREALIRRCGARDSAAAAAEPRLTFTRLRPSIVMSTRHGAQDFNILIWYKLFSDRRIRASYHREKVNAFFLRLNGISSVRAHPMLYLRHVAAHFYGMWRDLDQIVAGADCNNRAASCAGCSEYRSVYPRSLEYDSASELAPLQTARFS